MSDELLTPQEIKTLAIYVKQCCDSFPSHDPDEKIIQFNDEQMQAWEIELQRKVNLDCNLPYYESIRFHPIMDALIEHYSGAGVDPTET